jgi:methionyl aminopeptidase
MIIKNQTDLVKLKSGGEILSKVLKVVKDNIQIGITTKELDNIAQKTIKNYGAKASFLGFEGYPAALCTSVNEQLVHGLPSNYQLKSGDIIGIDCGVWYEGFCTDMALTIGVGNIDKQDENLINITKQSLFKGLKKVKAGQTVGDYGAAVQNYVEKNRLAVIRGLVGHGVGQAVHEEPRVPNFGEAGKGDVFLAGMVLALEPMVTIGSYQVETLADGWTIVMTDGANCAHFELTIIVTSAGYELITPII